MREMLEQIERVMLLNSEEGSQSLHGEILRVFMQWYYEYDYEYDWEWSH